MLATQTKETGLDAHKKASHKTSPSRAELAQALSALQGWSSASASSGGDGPSAARAQATQAAAARVATAVKHQLLGMSEDEERTAGACLPAASPDARLHHPRLMSSVCERA